MIENIDTILELQNTDLRLLRRITHKHNKTKALEDKLKSIAEVDEGINNLQAELPLLNKKKSAGMAALQAEQDKLDAENARLEKGDNIDMKMYAAIDQNKKFISAAIAKLAEEIELTDSQIIECERSIAEAQKPRKDLVSAAEEAKKTHAEEIKALDAEIAEDTKKRKELALKVDPELLKQYEKQLRNTRGAVLVPVEKGACSGCHLLITAQQENLVKKSNKLTNCEHCHRFQYATKTEAAPAEGATRKRRGRKAATTS